MMGMGQEAMQDDDANVDPKAKNWRPKWFS